MECERANVTAEAAEAEVTAAEAEVKEEASSSQEVRTTWNSYQGKGKARKCHSD